MENKEHDFKAPIEKTSVGLAKVILTNYMDNFDLFVYEDIDVSKEQEAILVEKTTDFAINVMALMSTTDIPADYATYSIDKIMAGLSALKQYIDGSLRQHQDEILARAYGAKSPVTNTYAKDCATLGDVMLTLKKVREETGNKPEDYFVPKKVPAELSTEEDGVVEKKEE